MEIRGVKLTHQRQHPCSNLLAFEHKVEKL